MDARSAGKLGGRPTKAVSLGKRAAAAVANGSQRTLNFGGSLTFSGPVTSEEQFTLGNVAAELDLEPRRANLLGAFEDAADGHADEADGQDEPVDAVDGAAA